MAFVHSTQWRFGTNTCLSIPRDLPSSYAKHILVAFPLSFLATVLSGRTMLYIYIFPGYLQLFLCQIVIHLLISLYLFSLYSFLYSSHYFSTLQLDFITNHISIYELIIYCCQLYNIYLKNILRIFN